MKNKVLLYAQMCSFALFVSLRVLSYSFLYIASQFRFNTHREKEEKKKLNARQSAYVMYNMRMCVLAVRAF